MRIHAADTIAAATATPALAHRTLCVAVEQRGVVDRLAGGEPGDTGMPATATRLPVRATALLTPEAIPASCDVTELSAVVVSGATVNVSPVANTRMPGSTAST